ncbi:MAG: hypothetical protein GY946_02790 [bacterium]|nr:hypothetical protein [bacterium]
MSRGAGMWGAVSPHQMQNTKLINGRRHLHAVCLTFTCALLLSACGLADLGKAGDPGVFGTTGDSGPGSTTSGAPLVIATNSIPAASTGDPYGPVLLSATGARSALTWSITTGQLPDGLSLSTDGRLLGAPSETGFFPITVKAADSFSNDTQDLAVAVDTFGAYVASGLHHGDAWGDMPVRVQCVGHSGNVTVEISQNSSGGYLSTVNAAEGWADYVPGLIQVVGASDRLLVTDDRTGLTTEIVLSVAPNPLSSHAARFGTTDVWYVDFNLKTGSHGFSTDLHAALARVGLRNPASTGVVGTATDSLCEMAFRVAVLRHLNPFFLRHASGEWGEAGMSISFPYHLPDAPYSAPARGTQASGSSGRYNVMAICENAQYGLLGAAILDNGGPSGNSGQENNSPGGSLGNLGVFINRITDNAINAFDDHGDLLTAAPIHAGDTEALKSVLYGEPASGARGAAIEYMLEGLARAVATVLAHEIGHSLGLSHTSYAAPTSAMNSGMAIHEDVYYSFLGGDQAFLDGVLPGAGRAGAGNLKRGVTSGDDSASMPDGGICACGQ